MFSLRKLFGFKDKKATPTPPTVVIKEVPTVIYKEITVDKTDAEIILFEIKKSLVARNYVLPNNLDDILHEISKCLPKNIIDHTNGPEKAEFALVVQRGILFMYSVNEWMSRF